MSKVLSILFIVLVIIPATAQASYDGTVDEADTERATEIREFQLQVNKIKKDSKFIYESFEIFELEVIEETYSNLNENVSEIDKALSMLRAEKESEIEDAFYTLYNSTMRSYTKLTQLYDFYLALEDKKDRWSSQYFRLWETTYALKGRIDALYVREEKMNMHYGGMKDYKYESVRKRNVYESCNAVYNSGIMQLKGTGDCDHYERIQILGDLVPVLRKCEKLSYSDNTKKLEKQLKKIEDPEQKSRAILDFIIE